MVTQNKIKENALTKCDKCDCLIVSDSDSSNGECIRPDADNEVSSDEKSKLVSQNCQSSVKIIVHVGPCPNCESCGNLNKKLNTMRKCFGKKKKGKKEQSDKATDVKSRENTTTNTEQPEKSETNLACNCDKCKKGSGCNTNTIVFPSNLCKGDCPTNLEEIIKNEAKINSRNIEDILNELLKQRREIREVRDNLEIIVRLLREQCFMACRLPKSGTADLLDDLCKKNCLERKSNTLSINGKSEPKSSTKAEETSEVPNTPLPPENGGNLDDNNKKKKKPLCPWCK